MAVVGDPVALVSVGKCRKLWERFIEIAAEKKSLIGFNQDTLKSHLEAIELKKIYGLNPLADEFVPKVPETPMLDPGLQRHHVQPPQYRAQGPPPMPLFMNPYLSPAMILLSRPLAPGAAALASLLARGPLPPGYPPLFMPPLPPLLRPPGSPIPPPPYIPPPPPPDLNGAMFPPLVPNPSSAAPAPGKSDSETDLLPAGVNILQMRANPVLAKAWFDHLKERGKDAEAFRQLVSGPGPQMPPPAPASQQKPVEGSQHLVSNSGASVEEGRTREKMLNAFRCMQNEKKSYPMNLPPQLQTNFITLIKFFCSAGCTVRAQLQAPVNSNHPGPGDKQHISESVIQSIFGRKAYIFTKAAAKYSNPVIISGDLEPLSELAAGGSDNVPLYMRGAEPESRHKPELEEVQGRGHGHGQEQTVKLRECNLGEISLIYLMAQ